MALKMRIGKDADLVKVRADSPRNTTRPLTSTCYLIEYSEDWGSDRSYIQKEKILTALEQSRELLGTHGAK